MCSGNERTDMRCRVSYRTAHGSRASSHPPHLSLGAAHRQLAPQSTVCWLSDAGSGAVTPHRGQHAQEPPLSNIHAPVHTCTGHPVAEVRRQEVVPLHCGQGGQHGLEMGTWQLSASQFHPLLPTPSPTPRSCFEVLIFIKSSLSIDWLIDGLIFVNPHLRYASGQGEKHWCEEHWPVACHSSPDQDQTETQVSALTRISWQSSSAQDIASDQLSHWPSFFLSFVVCFGVTAKKPLPNPRYWTFTPVFL